MVTDGNLTDKANKQTNKHATSLAGCYDPTRGYHIVVVIHIIQTGQTC